MKHLTLLFFCLLFAIGTQAQFGLDQRFSAGINIAPAFTKETPTLVFTWNPNPDKNKHSWIRTQVGFSSNSQDGNRTSKTQFQFGFGNQPIDSTITTHPSKTWDLFVAIGFARSLDLTKGFYLYYGTDLLYGHGQHNSSSYIEVVQSFSGTTQRQYHYTDISNKSHYDTYGIRTVLGFSYMPNQVMSLGLESSFGVKKSIHQERFRRNQEIVSEFNPQKNINENNSKDKYNTSEWFLTPLTNLTFSIHF